MLIRHASWIAMLSPRIATSLVLVVACSLGFSLPPAAAHEPIDEQIAALEQRIDADPRNAALYLRRGGLESHRGDWQAALADYDRAGRLDSSLPGLGLARGRTLLDAGRLREAREELDRFLVDHPRDAEAWATRALASRALGLYRAAAEDFTRAITAEEEVGRTSPEHYLERARALASEGGEAVGEALRGLDEGLGRLGPIPALQLYAIDLEVVRRGYDAALARLDAVMAQSPPSGPWLARRGEVLERAGRPSDARVAYEQALADLASPGRKRRTGASAQLESQVRAALERLQRQEPAEAEP